VVATQPLSAGLTIQASKADATPKNDSPDGGGNAQSVQDKTKGVIRVGSYETNKPDRRCIVFVFTLPDTSAPDDLKTANFSVRLFSKRFKPDYNLDLWALRVAPPEKGEVQLTDYGVGPKPEGSESQVLLEASFVTPASPDKRIPFSTDDAALVLAKFLKDHWIPGGKLFLRLNAASTPDFGARDEGGTKDQGYDFGSADSTNDDDLPSIALFLSEEQARGSNRGVESSAFHASKLLGCRFTQADARISKIAARVRS